VEFSNGHAIDPNRMTGGARVHRLVRVVTILNACALLAAASAFAGPPSPANCTLPCAIVLVGHDATSTADPYGRFSVVVRDAANTPLADDTVTVNFNGCCPDIRLSNNQYGPGVVHPANAASVTSTTDATGTATFIIEGAANQGVGGNTGFICYDPDCGCAAILAKPPGGFPVLLTNGVNHRFVWVSTPDENGVAGNSGVDITDLAVFIADKNLYTLNNQAYRQRSDFDFHLPAFACSAVFNAAAGFGVNLGDLVEFLMIKNAGKSIRNGPFPATCP
jgi:hypothetical protein